MGRKKSRPRKAVVKEPEPCICHQCWATFEAASKKIRLTEQNEAPEPLVGGSTSTENAASETSVGKPEENVKGESEAAAPKPQPQNPVKEAPGEGGEVSTSKAM